LGFQLNFKAFPYQLTLNSITLTSLLKLLRSIWFGLWLTVGGISGFIVLAALFSPILLLAMAGFYLFSKLFGF